MKPIHTRRRQAAPLVLRVHLSIESAAGSVLSDAGADLLEQLDAVGSLTDAARRLGFSYRHAWSLVQAMNQRAGVPLVRLQTGGARGGGTSLTEAGASLLRCYRLLQAQVQQVLEEGEPLIGRTLTGAASPPDLGKKRTRR